MDGSVALRSMGDRAPRSLWSRSVLGSPGGPQDAGRLPRPARAALGCPCSLELQGEWSAVVKIVVAYKWASNPQDASVGAGGAVDWSRAKPGISEYDPAAVELARGFADAVGGEVIGLTVGTKAVDTTMARKTVLSRRFDRAVIVADDSLDGAGSAEVATVLAAAVRHICLLYT